MSTEEMDALVNAIAEKVLKQMNGADRGAEQECYQGQDRVLVIGDVTAAPDTLCRGAVRAGVSEYSEFRRIERYKKVIITKLELLQMTDIALGRPTDDSCDAVIRALLGGVPVFLLEKALPHRGFSGQASTGMYALLEGYARKLMGFGIRLVPDSALCPAAPKEEKPAKFPPIRREVPKGTVQPNAGMLITETQALEMVRGANAQLLFAHGTIVTPSAKDVFKKAGVQWSVEA